ncbi:MAG: transcriptional repressor LexA [Propionibacteriaceae bacterium]|jgi:repressor LexA|nr:transcriptional repressor LexA [Propionibacteriaceae bacterium]
MNEGKKYPKTTQRGLSPRQRAILDVIKESLERRGYAPSMREIGDAVNLTSPSSVKHQLEVIEAKGYLRRDRRLPRAMEVIDPNADVPQLLRAGGAEESKPRYVPLVGRVAAGYPILAEQNVEALYPLPRELVGDGEVFMLTVHGDSMIDVAIADGDYVVVRRQPTAENGQIVAAQIGDEATIKTLDTSTNRVWLRPANPAYEPIEGHRARILGRVTCVIRSL